MAAKPKRKTKLKLTDKEQSERFNETARKLGLEKIKTEEFRDTFGKLVPPKKRFQA